MPTSQPSSAPEPSPPQAADETTAAAVLRDEQMDDQPGGGGMGGQAAADPLGGSARGGTGTAPNAPIDTQTSGAAGAEREAQRRALEDGDEPDVLGEAGQAAKLRSQ